MEKLGWTSTSFYFNDELEQKYCEGFYKKNEIIFNQKIV